QEDDQPAHHEARPVSDRAMLQDLIEPTPEACSAPNMSRHGRFPTSTRLFPVGCVGGQWELEDMPFVSGRAAARYSPPARASKPKGKGPPSPRCAPSVVECARGRTARVTCSSGEGQVTRRSG